MLLTGKQLEVLRFIRDYRLKHAISPTLDEIARNFRVSKITVHEHLTQLEHKGAIYRAKRMARAIKVLHDPDSPEGRGVVPGDIELPVLGTIAAGRPIEAIEDREVVALDELVPHSSNHYLLRVAGDSMIDEHIQDGDYVIVERRETAKNGEMVVAILEDNEATLKRFYRDGNRLRLKPANPHYAETVHDRLEIRGVVVGVVRKIR